MGVVFDSVCVCVCVCARVRASANVCIIVYTYICVGVACLWFLCVTTYKCARVGQAWKHVDECGGDGRS